VVEVAADEQSGAVGGNVDRLDDRRQSGFGALPQVLDLRCEGEGGPEPGAGGEVEGAEVGGAWPRGWRSSRRRRPASPMR
jgi:hypothetical protein